MTTAIPVITKVTSANALMRPHTTVPPGPVTKPKIVNDLRFTHMPASNRLS